MDWAGVVTGCDVLCHMSQRCCIHLTLKSSREERRKGSMQHTHTHTHTHTHEDEHRQDRPHGHGSTYIQTHNHTNEQAKLDRHRPPHTHNYTQNTQAHTHTHTHTHRQTFIHDGHTHVSATTRWIRSYEVCVCSHGLMGQKMQSVSHHGYWPLI